jgi:hypothetical protein
MAFRAEPRQYPQPQICEFDLRIEPCGQYLDHLSASGIRAKRDGRCERGEDVDDSARAIAAIRHGCRMRCRVFIVVVSS